MGLVSWHTVAQLSPAAGTLKSPWFWVSKAHAALVLLAGAAPSTQQHPTWHAATLLQLPSFTFSKS